MFSEDVLQLLTVLFDRTSLARSNRVSKHWQRACQLKLRDMTAASISIQCAVRRALAVVYVTRLRVASFDRELYTSVEWPRKLLVAHHARNLCDHDLCSIQWAVDKLEYNSMQIDAPHRNYGSGILGALLFLSSLDLEQLDCLGV